METSPRSYLGVAFMLGVVAVLAVGLIVVLSQQTEQGASDTEITQAHTQTRAFADPILALCEQGGDVAARLSAKGLCGAAEVVRSEPLGAASGTGMTPEQVQAMIRAEIARRPPVVIQQPPPVVVPVRPNVAPIPPVMDRPRPVERPRTVTPQRGPYPGARYLPESTSRRPPSGRRNYPNYRQREPQREPYQTGPPYQQREPSRQREQQPYQQQRPYRQQQQPYRQREQQQSPPAMPAPQSRRPEGLLSNLVGHII
jgi:hypothetical protein